MVALSAIRASSGPACQASLRISAPASPWPAASIGQKSGQRSSATAAKRMRQACHNSSRMWEAAGIVLIAAGIFVWIDSLRARERALEAGRAACDRHDLQFLDDTVSVSRVRLGRDDDGQLRIARTYTFEFSDTGNNRRHGAIVMLGGELQDLQLEPYRMQ